jgi:hypothetical protein
MNPPGWSAIFHFPYRIYADGPLPKCDGSAGTVRYRVYPPFLVKKDGTPTTQDVPRDVWPEFKWHPRVPEHLRVDDPVAIPEFFRPTTNGFAQRFDGIRVDLVAPQGQDRLPPFIRSFMRWLRYLSGQPWISDVDRHETSTLKRLFAIDGNGAAIGEPGGFAELRPYRFRAVTPQMWRQAFDLAVVGREVPIYANLYFDGINAAAADDYGRAVMNLAMALESCRDFSFSQLYPAKVAAGRGPRLRSPFHDTNFLRHISVDAQKVLGRDFSVEEPSHWPHLKKLYDVRHHVAHGKGAVFSTSEGLKVVYGTSYMPMQLAAATAVTWMETLARTKRPSPGATG